MTKEDWLNQNTNNDFVRSMCSQAWDAALLNSKYDPEYFHDNDCEDKEY
jgi:hypothetical protein